MTKYSRETWKKNDLRSKIESSRCDLCDKKRRPLDLSVKVSQYKTCGDVYMELSQISSDKATCSSGQQAYRSICCPSTSTFSAISSTVQTSVSSIPHRPTLAISAGIALILLFARRLLKRSTRDDDDDDSDARPSKKKKSRTVKESREEDYVVMTDEESQEKSSARRHRSASRSKSRGRERSQSKKRSQSRTNSKGRKSPSRKRGDTKQLPLVANQQLNNSNHRHPHDPRTRTRQMQQQQQIELYHPPSVQSMSTYQQPPYYENEYNLDDPNAMQEYYGPDYEYEQHYPPQHYQQQLAYYEQHGQQAADQDYYHLEDESTLANDNTVSGLETTGGGGTVDAIVTQVV